MIVTLCFLALLSSAGGQNELSDSLNETGGESGGGGGGGGGGDDRCTCDAFLPSSTFTIRDQVAVEQTAVEVSHKLDLEMGKLETYEIKLTAYAERIIGLVAQIEIMEKNPDDYTEANFDDIKVEIKQVEALIIELQVSIIGSTAIFESVHGVIMEMQGTLTRLESTHDKNSVLQTRREYDQIQAQLEECETRHDELFNPNIGSCAHGGIIKVGKPTVSHLNAHLNANYKYGGWGKDSKPIPDRESMYWYSGYSSTSIVDIRFYVNYKSLILRTPFQHINLHSSWIGRGNNFIVRDNTLYYQINSPFGLAKLNFTSMKYESRVIGGASSRFSYSNSNNQFFDLAADETGLWVTYATETSAGQMIIAKINEGSFGVEEEWQTDVYKPGVSNAFMACGVMYAVRTVDIETEELFYMYDTSTGKDSYISLPFERFAEKFSNLDYNPTDQKLYMYNDGYYVSYHLWFNHTTDTKSAEYMKYQ